MTADCLPANQGSIPCMSALIINNKTMNLKINGFELSNVSVEEAIQLIKPNEVSVSKKVFDVLKPKRTYHKKAKKIRWTDEDNLIIVDNIELKPRELWKMIGKRHTLGAVCFQKRNIKNKFNLK